MTEPLHEIPTIHLAANQSEVLSGLASACSEWGIFQVTGHGIPDTQIERVLAASTDLFQLPAADKRRLYRSLENPWGYFDRELTKNLRDRKEIFDFSDPEEAPWPPGLPCFRTEMDAWAASCHGLAMQLLRLISDSLRLSPEQLDRYFTPGHSSFTRLNYYPTEDPLAGEDAPAAGPLGISHHSDAGALTILLQDEVSSLQVQHNGQWHAVTPVPGTLTINLGDMIQVWSNDRYRAPEHQVRASTDRDRYSIAYFLNPDYEADIQPLVDGAPRYRNFSWREFRELRAQGDYGDYGEEVQISNYSRTDDSSYETDRPVSELTLDP